MSVRWGGEGGIDEGKDVRERDRDGTTPQLLSSSSSSSMSIASEWPEREVGRWAFVEGLCVEGDGCLNIFF